MPRSVAPLFHAVRVLAIAALVATPLALFGACTSESGVTPSCTPDIDSNGIKIGVDNGCTGFAICTGDATAMACCKSPSGAALTGNDLKLCLFAYGKSAPPSIASATSTSSGSSTGTGSGGAGGGA